VLSVVCWSLKAFHVRSRLVGHAGMQTRQRGRTPLCKQSRPPGARPTHPPQVRKVEAADVVIVEGILALHDLNLRDHLNMKVRLVWCWWVLVGVGGGGVGVVGRGVEWVVGWRRACNFPSVNNVSLNPMRPQCAPAADLRRHRRRRAAGAAHPARRAAAGPRRSGGDRAVHAGASSRDGGRAGGGQQRRAPCVRTLDAGREGERRRQFRRKGGGGGCRPFSPGFRSRPCTLRSFLARTTTKPSTPNLDPIPPPPPTPHPPTPTPPVCQARV